MHDARRIALHEAAHAVVRYLYGSWNTDHVRRFTKVTIEPEGGIAGAVHGHPERWHTDMDKIASLDYADIGSWDARTRRRIEHNIMVSLAGMVCEDLHGYESETLPMEIDGEVIEVYIAPAGSDMQAVIDMATLVGGSHGTQEAYVEWLHLRTHDFLSRPYVMASVEAVADALEEKRTLRYQEATEIIESAVMIPSVGAREELR